MICYITNICITITIKTPHIVLTVFTYDICIISFCLGVVWCNFSTKYAMSRKTTRVSRNIFIANRLCIQVNYRIIISHERRVTEIRRLHGKLYTEVNIVYIRQLVKQHTVQTRMKPIILPGKTRCKLPVSYFCNQISIRQDDSGEQYYKPTEDADESNGKNVLLDISVPLCCLCSIN